MARLEGQLPASVGLVVVLLESLSFLQGAVPYYQRLRHQRFEDLICEPLLLPLLSKRTPYLMEKHQDVTETRFSRSHLWKPIVGDIAAAAISATLITPVITVIDQYAS